MTVRNTVLRPYGTLMSVSTLLVFTFAMLSHADEQNRTNWTDLIRSRDQADRQEAGRIVTTEREKVIQELLAVVNSPVTKGEPFYDPATSRNVAIRLVGQLRAKEAVPALIGHLSPMEGQNLVRFNETMFSPAGYALIEIGLPSVPPLLDVLRKEGCTSPEMQKAIVEGSSVRFEPKELKRHSPLGDQCLKIIIGMLGGQHTQLLLETAIKDEATAGKRDNLESALALLASPKISEPLKQRGIFTQPPP